MSPYQKNKTFVWSYSFLKQYDNCPHAAFHKYIAKTIPFSESPQMAEGTKVHSALALRVAKGKPLPADMTAYESFAAPLYNAKAQAELKLGITREGKGVDFWDNQAWGRCALDVAIVIEPKAYILDWKNGKRREDPFELEVQALILNAHYPKLTNILGQFAWLQENALGPAHDLSDTQSIWAYVNNTLEEIEALDKNDEDEWRKKPTPLCAFCDVRKCEHNRKPE